jgi:hypothetical protein
MTQLTALETTLWDFKEGSVLPRQLQRFEAVAPQPRALSALLPLTQLQRLELYIESSDQQPLLRLAQLPGLQHMSLGYFDAIAAAGAAAAWPQLPQLRKLNITFCDDHAPLPSQMAAMLAAVAQCSGLTSVELHALESPTGSRDDARAVAACGALAGLTNLQDLYFHSDSKLAPGDAKELTALTGLTALCLAGLGSAVDDATAAALACRLMQLQDLDLARCELGSMTCFAAIGKLVHLTSLHIFDDEGDRGFCSRLTPQGLMLLTGLTRLQHFWPPQNVAVTHDVIDEFWAEVQAALRDRCGSSSLEDRQMSWYEATYDWEVPWFACACTDRLAAYAPYSPY